MEKNEVSKSLQETIKDLKNENNETHENLRRVELELEEMKSRQQKTCKYVGKVGMQEEEDARQPN